MSNKVGVIPALSDAYRLLRDLGDDQSTQLRFEDEIDTATSDLREGFSRFNAFVLRAEVALRAGKLRAAAEQIIRLRIEAMNISQDFSNLASDIAGMIREGSISVDK